MKRGDSYDVKSFDLHGLVGISGRTLEMHLKLYEGYVTRTSIPAQPGTTASRAPRQEGIIKDAIGLTDVKTLRARARQGIADGAMTASYKAKVETVIELPLLLQEMRAATENMNSLIEHARGGVERTAVLLHTAGAVGNTIQRVHETVRGSGRSLLFALVSMVAGFRAAKAVAKAHIHREGGMVNGKGEMLNDR